MESKLRKEHIFRSKLSNFYISNHLPIHTYCFQNLSSHHSRPYIINGATGEVFCHANVEITVRRVIVGLHNIGICKCDVVMLLLHNSLEFAFAFLDTPLTGTIATTINPLFTTVEIMLLAKISKQKLIITHTCHMEKGKALWRQNSHNRSTAITGSRDPGGRHGGVAILLWNTDFSGIIGLPKAMMLSHKNLVTCIAQQIDGEDPTNYIDREDLMLCVLPLFRVYSLSVMLYCLRTGTAILIMPKFKINKLMEMLEKYRVIIAPFVPPILLAIIKIPAEWRSSTFRR